MAFGGQELLVTSITVKALDLAKIREKFASSDEIEDLREIANER